MNFQLSKKINNYHMANEVLYALDAVEKTTIGHLSRLTLQKVIYLSGALAPIKDIVLEYMRFSALQLGPYKGEIQETVDHLVGTGLADVLYFEKTPKGALTHYVISDSGKEVVGRLIAYPHEQEKHWWITLVIHLVYSYLVSTELKGTDDEKIKDIAYQDPTYNLYKRQNLYKRLIDLTDENNLTYQLTEFLKDYAAQSNLLSIDLTAERNIEILLVTFMEYLYTGVLNDTAHESNKA